MTEASVVATAVRAAAERLAAHVVRTPLVPSPRLSAAAGSEVRLKLENLQRTGSFKLRGATHALLLLSPESRQRGVVAASSGNHGLGLASAAGQLGIEATVFTPKTAVESRRQAIRAAGARVEVHGDDCVEAEQHARQFAAAGQLHYVSPYNDLDVIAGQGTVAVELLQQWPEVERLYVALGGGGLISGIAAHARQVNPGIEIVACSPQASPAMAECVRAGAIIDVPCGETWSDSTAGGVEPGAITFALCRDLVDRYLELSETEIEAALVAALEHEHLLVEGAAAVALAGCQRDGERDGRRSAVIVCGGNLSLHRLQGLLAR